MRLAVAVVVTSMLAMSVPAYAQNTGTPAASPRQQPTGRAGQRQQRPTNMPPARGSTADTISPDNKPNRADTLEDERLNRILNGICRGC